jgi:hypothetical protein
MKLLYSFHFYPFPECAAAKVYPEKILNIRADRRNHSLQHIAKFSTRQGQKKPPISSPAISSSPSHEAAAEVVASSKFHAVIPRTHAAGNLAVHQYSPLSEPKLDILPPKPHPPTFEKRISAYVDLTAKSRTPHKFKHRIPILLESTGFTVQGGLVS